MVTYLIHIDSWIDLNINLDIDFCHQLETGNQVVQGFNLSLGTMEFYEVLTF